MELTDEAHWGEVFERNGALTITSMGHKSAGKWRVQKDQLCLDTGKEPGGGCYEVWLAGTNVELSTHASRTPVEGVLQKPPHARRSAGDCFDECKEEFDEEAVARHSACMSCRGSVGSRRNRRREIPKAYGWANPRQAWRHGADGQRALARPLSAQWNCDEHFNGAQANRQMASRTEPALHRVRERPDSDMLRRMDLRKRRRAATRRFVAVAGHPRAVERTQLTPNRVVRLYVV